MRVATFDLGEVDTDDIDAVEKAWNTWVDEMRVWGVRPSDLPIRSTATSTTYRMFDIHLDTPESEYVQSFTTAELSA